MVSVQGLSAIVFVLSIVSWLTYAQMKVMRVEGDLAKLASSLESLRATTREQQDLTAAGQRGMEEQARSLRQDVGLADKKLAKDVAALQRSQQEAVAAQAQQVKSLEERVQATSTTVSELESGADGVKVVARKTAELSESVAAQQQAVAGLTSKVKESTDVVERLVQQVVSLKEQFHDHSATPHLKVAEVTAATPTAHGGRLRTLLRRRHQWLLPQSRRRPFPHRCQPTQMGTPPRPQRPMPRRSRSSRPLPRAPQVRA